MYPSQVLKIPHTWCKNSIAQCALYSQKFVLLSPVNFFTVLSLFLRIPVSLSIYIYQFTYIYIQIHIYIYIFTDKYGRSQLIYNIVISSMEPLKLYYIHQFWPLTLKLLKVLYIPRDLKNSELK